MFLKFFVTTLIWTSVSDAMFDAYIDEELDQLNFDEGIIRSNRYLELISRSMNIPAIVAGISFNGSQVWTQAIGYTDLENDINTRIDSVWRIGSISKALTSSLIARMIDQKQVDLNRSIYDYLSPNVFPIKNWKNKTVQITLGQVMSHMAGLHKTQFPSDFYKQLHFSNVTETLSQFKDEPLLFAPGTQYRYSNYGFQVIGAIIESVLNQTFESAINEWFKELGMDSTFCERREQIIKHRTRYYKTISYSDNLIELANTDIADDLISLEAYWPTAGIVSTVTDLLTFGSHLIKWSKGIKSGGKSVSSKIIEKLWSPVTKFDPDNKFQSMDKLDYGYGWWLMTLEQPIHCRLCKISKINHLKWGSGILIGLNSLLMIEPQNEIVITLLLNHAIDRYHNTTLIQLGLDILQMFLQ